MPVRSRIVASLQMPCTKMKTKLLLAGLVAAGSSWLAAAPLTESTFTEIVKDVNVVTAATKAATAARVQAVVKAPDLVRTGPASRAELTAPDQTITRVGANTVFSFESAGRNINLERGSLLFHSPSGKGGGTIKSGGAAAAVLGTTIIVAAMPDGGFKVIVLEGRARVTLANGKRITLQAGQIIFIMAGQGASEVLQLNLGKLVDGSLLVNGFETALPSLAKIKQAVEQQEEWLARGRARGRARDTGLTPENFARERSGVPMNGIQSLDDNVYGMLSLAAGQRGGQGFPNLQDGGFGSVNVIAVRPDQSLVAQPLEAQSLLIEVNRQVTREQVSGGLTPPLPPTPLTRP